MESIAEKQMIPRRQFEKVNEIIKKHGTDDSALITILQEVQEEYRYLPEEIMNYVAVAMDIPPATVFGVATFYAQFSLEPKGKYVIRMCDGTACHIRGSEKVKEAIYKKIGLRDGKSSSDDMLFTVEIVSCLGACGLAPVVMINDTVYGQMTPEKISKVIDDLKANEGEQK